MQMKILSTEKYLAHWEKNAKVINRQSVGELSISIYQSTEHLKLDFAKSWQIEPNKQLLKFILMTFWVGEVDQKRSARLNKDRF